MRTRETPGWQPSWEGTIEKYCRKFVRKNQWRVDSINSLDDMMQDAYLTFMRVVASYPRITEARHFMALFKTAMNREMIDRSNYRTSKADVVISTELDVSEMYTDRIGETNNAGYLAATLRGLPDELKQALVALDDPQLWVNCPQTKLQKLAGLPATRESLNMRLQRVTGSKNIDLVGGLKAAIGV